LSWLTYVRIAGEGKDALYNLYIDGERVGEALTYEELREKINSAEEERACST